jgi:RimJ/RimL family protein N-acetyltransferase
MTKLAPYQISSDPKTSFNIESYEFSATKNSKLSIIKIDDAKFILSLRENPELNRYLSQVDSDLEKQREWIAIYKKREADRLEFYFIIKDMNNKSLGAVRLYDFQPSSFCWGSWIIKPDSPRKTAIESAINIYEFAFEVLGFSQSHFDVRNKNINVINFHKRMGAQIVKSNELDTFFIMTKDAYTKSKQDLQEFLI